jgi:UDP-4-amino-4,6-dideoxy-N-acetyl-beta-L-altrosamine N-acetyltransferase
MVHSDLSLVLCWRNQQEVRRNMFSQHEITQIEHQKWFEKSSQDPKKHLLIFEVNHQSIGFVNFYEIGSGGTAEWGFYTAPDAPRGSGQQLGNAALRHAFINLNLHRVCGQALEYNSRSIRMHKSLGFKQEGILRDQHFDGASYHHIICFGLLRNDWQPNP